MKVMVIGCTHAGTAAVLTIKKQHPDAQITVYERNDNISFLSCGIALYVAGIVKDAQSLFYCSPKKLRELDVNTCIQHDVLNIDLNTKRVRVRDLQTSKEFEDTFDKLIVTSGSWPVVPPIPGINQRNILLSKNYTHSQAIVEKSANAKKIVVVGAGYIGVELAEAFRENDKEVVLIDAEPRMLNKYMDAEFTSIAEESFRNHGIKLAMGEKVTEFRGVNGAVTEVVTEKNRYQADLVILSIGFRPNTELFKGQLQMLPNGALQVDRYMRTSHPDVSAAGDCCAVYFNPTYNMGPRFWIPIGNSNAIHYAADMEHAYIPLATNAVRMGALAAINLLEDKVAHPGTQGTSGIKIHEHNMAATGITEEDARKRQINADSVTITDNYRPEFMPTYEPVKLKVVYEKESRKILGAQLHSKMDLTQSINTLSVCIQQGMTITELAFVDFFFQPHFNKPWNFLNLAGLESLYK